MSASSPKKPMLAYLFLSVLCLIFSQVYLHFSHGVTSPYMQFLCLIPFFLGFLPAFFIRFIHFDTSAFALISYRCAVATLTIASMVRGILDIYGTTSVYLKVYPVLAILLFFLAGLTFTRRAS